MNKLCEYCQYNGPYGSIINPCENCPNNDFMINGTFPIVQPLRETTDHVTKKTYITATTGCRTNSNDTKINDIFATDLINDLPTADAVPMVYGRWIEYQIPHVICCSNCDWATDAAEKNFQYCPMCGAKMDGGDNGDA